MAKIQIMDEIVLGDCLVLFPKVPDNSVRTIHTSPPYNIKRDYKGYEIYTDEDGEFGIVFLSDRILLFGTMAAAKDVIEVSKGERQKVGGIILDAYNRLDDALVKSVFELPGQALDALTREAPPGELPISLEPFTDIDVIGFALTKDGETVTIKIVPHFLSTASAEDARDTLSGAITLAKGMLRVPEIKELLGNIEVSVSDSWMTMAFSINLSEIERLQEAFQQQQEDWFYESQ